MNPWPFLLINWSAVILGNVALIVLFKKSTSIENKVFFQTSSLLLLAAILFLAHEAYDWIYPNETYEVTVGFMLELPAGFATFISMFILGILGMIEVKKQARNLLTFTSLMLLTTIFLPFFLLVIGAIPIIIIGWKAYMKFR